MDGIILFADDKILSYSTEESSQSEENKLFKLLAESNPVLGLKDRDQIEQTLSAGGTFTAIIMDWQYDEEDKVDFEDEEDDEDAASVALVQAGSQKESKTFELLMRNDFYSLIYIYSSAQAEIEAKYGDILRKKFNGRIEFRDKSNLANTDAEAEQILKAINDWKDANKALAIPIEWNNAINKAVQNIFSSLNAVDPNWITELYNAAVKDGVNPSIEVINMFQNILSEKIIQNTALKKSIDSIGQTPAAFSDPVHYAALMRILYYGTTQSDDPIMTGDIFKDPEADKYFIIVTPECDLRHVANDPENKSYEVLSFSKGDFKKGSFKLKATIKAKPLIDKAESFKVCNFTTAQKTEISQELNKQINQASEFLQVEAFTQTNSRFHLLPCFEFEPGNYSGVAVIDFRFALSTQLGNSFMLKDRITKINTPYVQELRQRFLAYKGRVGVPGYSDALKKWILAAH